MKYSLESDARRAVRLSFTRVCSIQDRSQKTDVGGQRKIKKEIIIFKKAYEFALEIFKATKMFPKSQRFLMVERLEGTIIEVLENIVQANETQDKLPHLKLQLHPQKTKYLRTNQGVDLVGFRVFYFHRLVRRKNHCRFRRNLKLWQEEYRKGGLSASKLGERIRGWISYAEHGNSYSLRKRLLLGFTFRKN